MQIVIYIIFLYYTRFLFGSFSLILVPIWDSLYLFLQKKIQANQGI